MFKYSFVLILIMFARSIVIICDNKSFIICVRESLLENPKHYTIKNKTFNANCFKTINVNNNKHYKTRLNYIKF